MSDIDYIVKAVTETLDPEKIILFGSSLAKGNKGNDLDVAILQKNKPRVGQKSGVLLALEKLGYKWEMDPDIHIFSTRDFDKKLQAGDLFTKEIAKGKTIYVQ